MLIKLSIATQPASVIRCIGFTLVELLLVVTIVAILAALAMASYGWAMERSNIVQAQADIRTIEMAIERYYTGQNRYPETLADLGGAGSLVDPWGNPYQYLNIQTVKGKGKLRKDHALVPLNTDFDLYSMGKDGKSVSPLTAKASRDDIVRANNGGFIGLASDY